jgi:hypothetical protein
VWPGLSLRSPGLLAPGLRRLSPGHTLSLGWPSRIAREHGAEQYLPELVQWARQVYPSATRFEVFLENDAETEDRCIVFELDVPLSVEQALEADKLWCEGFSGSTSIPGPA